MTFATLPNFLSTSTSSCMNTWIGGRNGGRAWPNCHQLWRGASTLPGTAWTNIGKPVVGTWLLLIVIDHHWWSLIIIYHHNSSFIIIIHHWSSSLIIHHHHSSLIIIIDHYWSSLVVIIDHGINCHQWSGGENDTWYECDTSNLPIIDPLRYLYLVLIDPLRYLIFKFINVLHRLDNFPLIIDTLRSPDAYFENNCTRYND